jgi:hypothetical protein
MRRKWASDLLSPAEVSDGEGSPGKPLSSEKEKEKENRLRLTPSSFFKRFPSFRTIHLPLAGEHIHDTNDTNHAPANDVWSSESSDEDTPDELRYSRPPSKRLSVMALEQDDGLGDGEIHEL